MNFRPENDSPTIRVRLRGLLPKGRYELKSEEGSVPVQTRTGKTLMDGGVELTLPGQFSSDCVFVTRVSEEPTSKE